jgi:hypothetical protein
MGEEISWNTTRGIAGVRRSQITLKPRLCGRKISELLSMPYADGARDINMVFKPGGRDTARTHYSRCLALDHECVRDKREPAGVFKQGLDVIASARSYY